MCHFLYNVAIFVGLGAPVISPPLLNQTLHAGDTAIFTCQVTGTPITNITWYFNGVPVETANTMKYVVSETSFNPTFKESKLSINNVELSEMGVYTCNASNIISSDISSGMLTVNGE